MSESIVAVDEASTEALTVPEKRRAQIVETAIRLFSKRGYFQTTIEDIANAIPVSKGLVYKYFKDKNDLLYYCMQYVLEKYKLEEVPQLISKIGPLAALLKVMNIQCILAQEHMLEVVLAYRSTADLSQDLARQIKILEFENGKNDSSMFRRVHSPGTYETFEYRHNGLPIHYVRTYVGSQKLGFS